MDWLIAYNFFLGDFEGSDNEYENNDNSDFDGPDHKQFGRRHWERSDRPAIKCKEEKVNIA